MIVDNPCPHIDGGAVLVVSDMLLVRLFLSPYMADSGGENDFIGKGTVMREEA
jgi:hypothetical protein